MAYVPTDDSKEPMFRQGQNVCIQSDYSRPYVIRGARYDGFHHDWEYQIENIGGSVIWQREFHLRAFKLESDQKRYYFRSVA